MAFQISGIIAHIGNTEEIPYRDKVFRKRELVLDCSKRNQFTGQVEFPNFPKFEFTSNHVDDLNSFKIGDIVTVSFDLSGRRYEKDGKVSYFTNIQGFKVEYYQQERYNQQQGVNQPPQVTNGVPATNTTQGREPTVQAAANADRNAASAATKFPPAVDENGNPIGAENKDDLPF